MGPQFWPRCDFSLPPVPRFRPSQIPRLPVFGRIVANNLESRPGATLQGACGRLSAIFRNTLESFLESFSGVLGVESVSRASGHSVVRVCSPSRPSWDGVLTPVVARRWYTRGVHSAVASGRALWLARAGAVVSKHSKLCQQLWPTSRGSKKGQSPG